MPVSFWATAIAAGVVSALLISRSVIDREFKRGGIAVGLAAWFGAAIVPTIVATALAGSAYWLMSK